MSVSFYIKDIILVNVGHNFNHIIDLFSDTYVKFQLFHRKNLPNIGRSLSDFYLNGQTKGFFVLFKKMFKIYFIRTNFRSTIIVIIIIIFS